MICESPLQAFCLDPSAQKVCGIVDFSKLVDGLTPRIIFNSWLVNGAFPKLCSLMEQRLCRPVMLPCGKCLACRNRHLIDVSLRMQHELITTVQPSTFLTLTYNEAHSCNTLDYGDIQSFLKRLRTKALSPFRFSCCGEYGKLHNRPHWHFILYGFYPSDGILQSQTRGGNYYVSDTISKIWPFGFHLFAPASAGACSYLAKYLVKQEDGIFKQSLRPGVGFEYYRKYHVEFYSRGFCVMNGFKLPIPDYYDRILEREDKKMYEEVCKKRLPCYNIYDLSEFLDFHRHDAYHGKARCLKISTQPEKGVL
ncbi:replication initiator protein [Capybara microvirus Cap1_SP_230]|nr:replication initiator protein [Capybara microvirus Cap1_SP_230]